ncbi:MAG: HAD-IA family hydrolase [Actinobacteria bacterium]|jgi:HAD superfamily hydrolase (TIGR01509 family)|nr:HAD-IA family hydrolase [Actinomycetota bacterium]
MPAMNEHAAAPRPLEAVIFDCDGLLLDTETHWSEAETTLFARYGKTFGRDHKLRMIGSSLQATGVILEELLEQPGRAAEINTEMIELVEEAMVASEPMPGAADLVAELRGRVPVALASNSWRRLITVALHAAELADSFDVVVCGDEVEHPKPAPDIYLEATRLLEVAPERTIALEDSPNGVRAARAAGMFVIGVPSFDGIELPDAHFVADSLKSNDVRRALNL